MEVMELTEEQINEYKKRHGEIFKIVVSQEDKKDETFIFKKPTMTTLSASAQYESTDPIKAAQIMFNDTLVLGRKDAEDDVDVFPAIMKEMKKTFMRATASLKKL